MSKKKVIIILVTVIAIPVFFIIGQILAFNYGEFCKCYGFQKTGLGCIGFETDCTPPPSYCVGTGGNTACTE